MKYNVRKQLQLYKGLNKNRVLNFTPTVLECDKGKVVNVKCTSGNRLILWLRARLTKKAGIHSEVHKP